MLLKTKYDLDNAREQYGKLVDKQARKVLVCAGTGCVAGGSLNIYQKLIETISAKGLECVVALADEPHDDDVHEGAIGVKRSGCHGFCEMGPLVRIEPEGWLYTKVKLDDVNEIVDKTICNVKDIANSQKYHSIRCSSVSSLNTAVTLTLLP